MKKTLVMGNSKNFNTELASECVAFTTSTYFYKVCKEMVLGNLELKVCNKRIFVDVTGITLVSDLIDFVKIVKFFNKELNEVFIKCSELQKTYITQQLNIDKIVYCDIDTTLTVYC